MGAAQFLRLRRTTAIALVVLSSIIGSGCQFGKNHGGGGDGNSPTLVSITVNPTTVLVGQSVQITGYGTLSDGSRVQSSGYTVSWASSNTGVATIDPNTGMATGVKAGTATISATYQGMTGQGKLTVNAVQALGISTTSFPSGTSGTAYASTQLNATGGIAPYLWSTTSTLPNGMSLSSTGILSGTPTGSGTFPLVIQVMDSASIPNTATANLTLTVGPGSGVYACGTGSGYESLLSGTYAFLLNGFDDAGHPQVVAGSFSANGTGTISGGEEDVNNTATGAIHSVITGTGSSYTLGPDYRGCLVLAGNTPVTYSFTLSSAGSGKGRVIEFDDNTGSGGTRMAGVLRVQDPSSFALSQLQPNYALGVHGWDAAQSPVAAAGSFTNSNGTLSNGFADLNDGGSVTPTLAGITGSISSISNTSGRGAMTFGPSGMTLDFTIYVVNAQEFFMVGVDPITSAPITSGEAIATTNSFSNASLSGPYMFALSGYTGGGGDVTIGTLTFDGVGTAQGTLMEDQAGTSTSSAISGTYSVNAASGRVTLTNVGHHSPVVYLTNPADGISGFVVGTDASASWGIGESQPGGPLSANSLSGNYVLGTMSPPDSATVNVVGTIGFTSGLAAGTEDLSKAGANGLLTSQAINQAYTVNTNGTGNAGTNTAAVTNGSTIFFVDETPGQDPEIVVIEQ